MKYFWMEVLSFLAKVPPVPLVLWLLLFPSRKVLDPPRFFVSQLLLLIVLGMAVAAVSTNYVLDRFPILLR